MMPRRTPMEVFINAQTDRQAAYEKRRREQGLTKCCVWLPTECVEEWKEKARHLVAEKQAKASPESPPDPR
jgi:phage terminase small subunit